MSIFRKFWDMFSLDMGIDLGTANTLVSVVNEGIVVAEPSVVAVLKDTNIVIRNGNAVGDEAKKMLGRTHEKITAIRPIKHGVITNFAIAEAMLRYFIKKAQGGRWTLRPRVVIAIPSGITGVEQQAVFDSATRAGAKEVHLVKEPLAAGMGAGLPIADAVGSMIVDIGGGTTEVAVLSLGGIVTSESLRVAGDDLDLAIILYLKKAYDLLIGEQTAEYIKKEIGSAFPSEQESELEIRGRDLKAMVPRKIIIHSAEIREALQTPVSQIVQTIKGVLERTPPELAGDLVEEGITLAGGGALLRGIAEMIERETDLNVNIAEDPLTAVARGTEEFLKQIEILKEISIVNVAS